MVLPKMSPVVTTSLPHQDHNPHYSTASYSMLFSPAASSLASIGGTPGGGFDTGNAGGMIELDVHWNPTLVKSELLKAAAILSHRGLKVAAKWASEQVIGIPVGEPASLLSSANEAAESSLSPSPNHHHHPSSNSSSSWQDEWTQLSEKDWYAKTLLDLGENLHAAAVLSKQTTDVTQMNGPLLNLSPFGTYLRAYALYLAGERRKEEDFIELQRYVKVACCCDRFLDSVAKIGDRIELFFHIRLVCCLNYDYWIATNCHHQCQQQPLQRITEAEVRKESVSFTTNGRAFGSIFQSQLGCIRSICVWDYLEGSAKRNNAMPAPTSFYPCRIDIAVSVQLECMARFV